MIERIPKSAFVAAAIAAPLVLAYLAYSRPGYFTSQIYIGGLVLLEFLIAAVWMYRTVYFPVIVAVFLLAGMGAPGGWTAARWLFLAVGAWVGVLLIFKERNYAFGLFNAAAGFTALAALISAAVSRFPEIAVLKALSLLLLFTYAGTGVRIAAKDRQRFFSGLLIGVEIFVGLIAVLYALRLEVMGNPNSLGAVMGVVGAPMLLWGVLMNERPSVHRRRVALLLVCIYLIFHSHARAAIAASMISAAVLCLGLRKYKLMAQGAGVLLMLTAAVATLQPKTFSDIFSAATSSIMYKGRDPRLGIFASRETPWQAATESIRSHFWFGTGFGTSDSGDDANAPISTFSTEQGVSTENGNSYLAVLTWVGVAGVVPFFFLLIVLGTKMVRTLVWMFKTRSPAHPAVPLMLVLLAGLVHAGFEDWLFAPGYYLCVFFWSMAFIVADVAPSPAALTSPSSWAQVPQHLGIAPSR